MSITRILLLSFSMTGPAVLIWAADRSGIEIGGFPSRQELTCGTLEVSGVTQETYGARVRVKASVAQLFYSRKSGDFDNVTAALSSSAKQPLTICYRRLSLEDSDAINTPEILEVRSSQGPVRSLEEVRRSWHDDRKFLFAFAPFMLLGSTYLAYLAGKSAANSGGE